jgi:hypothetical protein
VTALIWPLVMLASGALTGVMLWRALMRDPAPRGASDDAALERLSQHDQRTLEEVLREQASRP